MSLDSPSLPLCCLLEHTTAEGGNRREHPSNKRLREEDNENQNPPMFHQASSDKKTNFQVRTTAHETKSSCHNSVRSFLCSPNLQVCPRWSKGA